MNTLFRHKKVVLLTALMVIVSFLIAILSIILLYKNAENAVYERLTDIVKREKSTISVYENTYHSSEREIIAHLKRVRKNNVSIGKNGEIAFVKIENDSLRFLVYDSVKNYDIILHKKNVPITAPMFLALQGKSGFLKGTDIRGIKVFAAYAYIEKLNWGIIAKIPISEIDKPFIQAAILVLILSSILISICTFAFIRITNPLIDKIIDNEHRLTITNRNLEEKIIEIKQTEEQLEEHEKRLLEENEKYEAINRELKNANDELFVAKEKAIDSENKLRELNATKDKLFSIIAHDLRSPFNSILGYSELLLENEVDIEAEKVAYIKIVQSSAKTTLNLLDNLLNWAKSQTGQFIFKPEKLNLSSVIGEIIEISSSTAEIKNISLFHVPSTAFDVCADKNMLQTILRNLVSNALKFTNPNGRIKIYTKEVQDYIEITISDNGVGMDGETLSKLFQIDKKLISAGTANEKGSGLGLIVCKEFVEKQGGKIWIESETGKGCNSKFTIPIWKG
jgi:signal transduction histidine kinase